MTRFVTFLTCMLSVGACTLTGNGSTSDPTPDTLPRTHVPADGVAVAACAPREWSALVGRSVAEVRLPAGLTYRVMPRGAIITDEYRDERLNIITDPVTGRIVDVSCG
ncbi:I78 family peptidase inhibitor [uncultured Paracoccus sp.]|uniref:I78 family peptidase inhibitor n=1 Tax=uncultured Paracoccus sp. TaxID=189685 RepID=UPI002617E06D|nr:I78 family peptidase inhibitor [uncultured Paracoccus sp.]